MDAKKLLLLVGVVFIGFWLFKDPQGLADVATVLAVGGWDFVSQLFDAAISFANEIF